MTSYSASVFVGALEDGSLILSVRARVTDRMNPYPESTPITLNIDGLEYENCTFINPTNNLETITRAFNFTVGVQNLAWPLSNANHLCPFRRISKTMELYVDTQEERRYWDNIVLMHVKFPNRTTTPERLPLPYLTVGEGSTITYDVLIYGTEAFEEHEEMPVIDERNVSIQLISGDIEIPAPPSDSKLRYAAPHTLGCVSGILFS